MSKNTIRIQKYKFDFIHLDNKDLSILKDYSII